MSTASPHTVDARPDEDVPWWLPSWSESARLFGWRWILFMPAALVLVALFLVPLNPHIARVLIVLWKPIALAVVIPGGVATAAMRSLVRRRTEPFCIHCGYDLTGLADGQRCPECGRRFSWALIDEYRRDPHWFIRRWKMHRESPPPRDIPFAAGRPRTPRRSRDGT